VRAYTVLILRQHSTNKRYPYGAHRCHIGTAIKHPVPVRVKPSFVIFDIRERQSARTSTITNDGLTRCSTGCFTAVRIWQQWASKGLNALRVQPSSAQQQCVRLTRDADKNTSCRKSLVQSILWVSWIPPAGLRVSDIFFTNGWEFLISF